jgi:hypothetical protein
MQDPRRDRAGGRPADLAPIPPDLLDWEPQAFWDWIREHRTTVDPYLSITKPNLDRIWSELYLLLADRFGIDVDGDPFLKFQLIDWLHYYYIDALRIPHPEYPDEDDPKWEQETLRLADLWSRNTSILISHAEQCQRRSQHLIQEVLEKRAKKENT